MNPPNPNFEPALSEDLNSGRVGWMAAMTAPVNIPPHTDTAVPGQISPALNAERGSSNIDRRSGEEGPLGPDATGGTELDIDDDGWCAEKQKRRKKKWESERMREYGWCTGVIIVWG